MRGRAARWREREGLLFDGMTVAAGGFGLCGIPEALIAALRDTGVKNLTLAVGARNLFDKNPPIYVPVSNQFQAGYDISQYDPRARFVYLAANYKF